MAALPPGRDAVFYTHAERAQHPEEGLTVAIGGRLEEGRATLDVFATLPPGALALKVLNSASPGLLPEVLPEGVMAACDVGCDVRGLLDVIEAEGGRKNLRDLRSWLRREADVDFDRDLLDQVTGRVALVLGEGRVGSARIVESDEISTVDGPLPPWPKGQVVPSTTDGLLYAGMVRVRLPGREETALWRWDLPGPLCEMADGLLNAGMSAPSLPSMSLAIGIRDAGRLESAADRFARALEKEVGAEVRISREESVGALWGRRMEALTRTGQGLFDISVEANSGVLGGSLERAPALPLGAYAAPGTGPVSTLRLTADLPLVAEWAAEAGRADTEVRTTLGTLSRWVKRVDLRANRSGASLTGHCVIGLPEDSSLMQSASRTLGPLRWLAIGVLTLAGLACLLLARRRRA